MLGERPPPANFEAGQWYSHLWYLTANYKSNIESALGTIGVSFGFSRCLPRPFGPGSIDEECDQWHFWSQHANGANFAFADGSVRFLPYSVAAILPDFASIAGGETTRLPVD